MQKKDLRAIVAKNLKFFMALPGCEYRNPHALGTKAGVAPNTVRNLLDPKRRTTTANKPEGYPTLDKLEKIAPALNCEVWELLHPDIERSLREREMYRSIQKNYEVLHSAEPAEHLKR